MKKRKEQSNNTQELPLGTSKSSVCFIPTIKKVVEDGIYFDYYFDSPYIYFYIFFI